MRCSGIVTPMNTSPSPYSPGPVLKKRAVPTARSVSATASSAATTSFAVALMRTPIDAEGDVGATQEAVARRGRCRHR